MFNNYSKSRFARLFSGKNFLVVIAVVYAFYALNAYRRNDPLPISASAPDFKIRTADNQTFNLYDIKMPVILVFFNDYDILANNMFTLFYNREMPQLSFLQEQGGMQVIILVKKASTAEELQKFSSDKKYAHLKNMLYITDSNKNTGLLYGVRSWPHYFLIDKNHKIRDTSKMLSTERIRKQLRTFN